MSITTTLHKVKETKSFVAFETAPDSEAVFGTTYVSKEAARLPPSAHPRLLTRGAPSRHSPALDGSPGQAYGGP